MLNNIFSMLFTHQCIANMDMNKCSQGCLYCYARAYDCKSAKDVAKSLLGSSFLAKKVQDGYPFCLSNNTDPFGKSNENLTKSILEISEARGLNPYFQTKTSYNMLEMVKGFKKSIFYISIPMLDEQAGRIELNSPPPTERFKIAEELIKMGHYVNIAINPLTKEWTNEDDFLKIAKKAKEIGAIQLYICYLYFKENQMRYFDFKKMGISPQEYFTESENKFYVYEMACKYAKEYNTFIKEIPVKHTSESPYFRALYGDKFLPVGEDFTNWIIENKKDGEEILLEEFIQFYKGQFEQFFDNQKILNNALYAINMGAYLKNIEKRKNININSFLEILFTDVPTSPTNNDLIVRKQGNKRFYKEFSMEFFKDE